MAIKDWQAEDRPREKLLARGAEALSDAELLAIFLRTGVAGKSALDMARELLAQFGSLQALMEADLETFTQVKGLGPVKYVQLQANLAMAKRYLRAKLTQQPILNNSEAVADYLALQLQNQGREVFYILYLNNELRLIDDEALFLGGVNSTQVQPREVVRQALLKNAVHVVLAHNHPSGNLKASEMDKKITQRLKSALELVEISLVDHIIVGVERQYLSFHQAGLL